MQTTEPHDEEPAGDGTGTPFPPAEPKTDGAEYDLYNHVRQALLALPSLFKPDLVISGVLATDLHTFNTSLGATIETQVTDALNELRNIWDPAKQYAHYRFVRQSQTFPDVVLKSPVPDSGAQIIMGIELKGWFALAKEKEPSFRYKVTPAVCAPNDLLVVYPWALSNVISGKPVLFAPYVVNARFAAEYRNWHWQYQKKGAGKVLISSMAKFYPAKSDPISDVAESDAAGNFGRFARTGLMDRFKAEVFAEELSGIPISAWTDFFSIFSQDTTAETIAKALSRLSATYKSKQPPLSNEAIERVRTLVAEIAELLQTGG